MEETLSYAAWLHFEGTDGVGVTFPDFPGCVTQGDTVEDALRLAPEALAFHIEGMLEDGAELPEASPVDDVVKERAGELLTMVNVLDPRPRERINISLTAGQVAKIDRAAARNGMSRSAFVVAAALGLKKKGKRLTS
jgi:predicted RNase H-like HicB family nuclease